MAKGKSDAKPKTKGEERAYEDTVHRAFSILQYKGRPFEDYEEDRITLKPGANPLITEETIIHALNYKTIKRWAWVWHDKDIYTPKDEAEDEKNRIKAGEHKFCHAHIMIEVSPALSIKKVAEWFKVPTMLVRPLRGKGAFIDAVEYLPHETPNSIEEKKYHYPDEEIHANFNFRKELAKLQDLRKEFGENARNMTDSQILQHRVLKEGWSLKMCRDYDNQAYIRVRDKLPKLRVDYLYDQDPADFRLNIYITGHGGAGKGGLSQHLAKRLVKDLHKPDKDKSSSQSLIKQTGYDKDNPVFEVGNDKRVSFDGYDGEPVLIWDDMRGDAFHTRFQTGGTFNILDSHPKRQAQQAKGTRVILTNTFNIINSTQDYDEFIRNIAGWYTDGLGRKHVGEDVRQAYRRIPLIINLRDDDFDILVREDIVEGRRSVSQNYVLYACVQGSIQEIMQELSRKQQEEVLNMVSEPIVKACQKIVDTQFSQFSEIEELPEKFHSFGTITGGIISEDGGSPEGNSAE